MFILVARVARGVHLPKCCGIKYCTPAGTDFRSMSIEQVKGSPAGTMYPATPSPPSSMLLPRSSSLSSSPMAVVPFAPAKCDLELSVSFSQPDLDSEVSVSALGFLPADSVSKAYPVEEICQKTAIPSGRRITIRKSSSTGLLTPNEADSVMKSCNWIRSIKLASDVRSYNAVLELTQSQLIRLRLIRDVTAEEELQLWFSEDVAALMQIPFLTPANIQREFFFNFHQIAILKKLKVVSK